MNCDQALELAVNNLAHRGLSDITSSNIECLLMSNYKDDFRAHIKASLNCGNVYEMEFKSIQHMLTPKNRYVFDYRRAALIEPSCLAKFTALVLMAAEEIEHNRVPISENVVYSYRFKPNGNDIFDPTVNYSAWKERTKSLANEQNCTFLVQCDIAAFYDRINIHRIESTLDSIGVEKGVVRKLNELLLFWTKKDSYGLPVGNVASRILAEAVLIDVDDFLMSENIRFTRYVDDYRFFAPDIVTAQRWMNKLNTRLLRDGLMLNTGKTKLSVAQKFEESGEQAGTTNDDAEAVLKVITRLTGGYSRIVRTFIMPSSDKYDPFKRVVVEQELNDLRSASIVDFSSIQKLVIASLVQERFDMLVQIAETCSKYMYALDYFIDMLLKNKNVIPAKHKNDIADWYMGRVIGREFYSFEWHEATIAKLLSDPDYYRKKALINIIRNTSKEAVTYPSQIALEGLIGKLTRSEFRTMREWFDRSDDGEKRRMLRASMALPKEERIAWAKAVRPSFATDFLGQRYASAIAKEDDIPI